MNIYFDFIANFGVPILIAFVVLLNVGIRGLRIASLILLALVILLSFNAFENHTGWFGEQECKDCRIDVEQP